MDETTIKHAHNSSGFPQLRIMFNPEQVTGDGEGYVSIGVLDSLGNTEWTEATILALARAMDEIGLVQAMIDTLSEAITTGGQ
jgi:hypothetical protein